MRIKLVYFAWVREQIGKQEEQIELPANVTTIAELLEHLKLCGEEYAAALEHTNVIRTAINQEHVEHDEPIGDGMEIALFPPMTGG